MILKYLKNNNFIKFSSVINYKFSSINLELLKEIRELTGAPILSCKKALESSNNNKELSLKYLKEKYILTAQKKSERVLNSGVLGIEKSNNSTLILEVNSETDFVSKSQDFIDFVIFLKQNLKNNLDSNTNNKEINLNDYQDIDNLLENITVNDHSLRTEKDLISGKVQENIKITKLIYKPHTNKIIGYYIHNESCDNIGKYITTVECLLNSDYRIESKISDIFLQNLAIHCFSNKPEYIKTEDYKDLENFKTALINELPDNTKKKPKDIINKIIEGKLNKKLQDCVFYEQKLAFEESDMTIKEYINAFNKNNNTDINVIGYNIYTI